MKKWQKELKYFLVRTYYKVFEPKRLTQMMFSSPLDLGDTYHINNTKQLAQYLGDGYVKLIYTPKQDFYSQYIGNLQGQRRSGNSTRVANFLINTMFDRYGYWVPIYDHAREANDQINIDLINRIEKRIAAEHRGEVKFEYTRVRDYRGYLTPLDYFGSFLGHNRGKAGYVGRFVNKRK